MSYNVSDFTIKKMEGFTLPLAALKEHAGGRPRDRDGLLTFGGFDVEGMEVEGRAEGERLVISRLSYFGLGSGRWWEHFEELLGQSTGHLRARVTWEGGDTVELLTVQDGKIAREEV